MIKFGFVSIGQGGGNIANHFAEQFTTVAINTAIQDLEGLNSISESNKILMEVSRGGAGKDIKLGEQAIVKYREQIKKHLKLVFKDHDYIWIVAGLGGGTGSLGSLHLVSVLSEIGLPHGLICTVPAKSEGTYEKANALTALTEIYKAHQQAKNFRSIIIIDNEQLQKHIKGNYSYEEYWNKANKYIFDSFYSLYGYTSKPSITAFDPEDYKRIFMEKGCMNFGNAVIDELTETSYITEAVNSWENIFLTGEVADATGVAVVVERKKSQDNEAIQKLYEEIKDIVKSGLICRGIYTADQTRISTVLSGIPFPIQQIKALKAETEKEVINLENKKLNGAMDIDVDFNSLFSETDNEVEELDFTVFKQDIVWKDFS